MLGRAVKEAPKPSNDLAKQLFPSSSPAQNGNIQEQFKKARQSQSIGAFTGYTNTNTTIPLRAKSPNVKQSLKRKSLGTSAPATSALTSVLSKQDSFQHNPNTLTQEGYILLGNQANSGPCKLPTSSDHGVLFDENDFEDDADLDLDMDFELPASMAAPPKPSLTSPSPYTLPNLPHQAYPNSSQNLPSSAVSWATSSPSHRLPPVQAKTRQESLEGKDEARNLDPRPAKSRTLGTSSPTYRLPPTQAGARQEALDGKNETADLNPRPAKRRTLPWAQKQAEDDQIAARKEEIEEFEDESSASSQLKCLRCGKDGHDTKSCPTVRKGKATAYDFTPIPKDKRLPWNTTGSAIAQEKKLFKDKQKAARKVDNANIEAMEGHYNKKKVGLAPISLSEEQKRVKDLVVNQSKSVFFTGSAGTGKSVLMRSIIAELRKKYAREPDRVAVTASTGLAACNIGGVTLHSFGGIGLGKEDVPALVKKIKRNQKAKNRWLRTKILIIDEISMVDGDLFDKLEGIARIMRNNGRPFGGIQLVITGDFFQLPPVPDYDSKSKGVKFAFDAGTWSTAIHHTIGLTEVFRQKDPVFANMLNEMRLGKITNETVAAFRKLNRKIIYEDNMEATELFPTRNEVENSNAYKMRDLVGKVYKYEAVDSGTIQDQVQRDKLLSNMMAPKVMELKKGAQVMLIKNMNDGLVNGSLGKVISFMDEKTFEIYDRNPGLFKEGANPKDMDDMDEEDRARFSAVKASFSSKKASNSGIQLPLVQFSLADGTIQEILVQPEEWKVELPNGEIQAQRVQLPLILAWALSIHKAQGQTLERVKIDLKRVFEKGQAYVALSRATSQAGLEVHNFDKNKVMAHPRVAQFYDSLYSVNQALKHPKVAKSAPVKKASAYEEEFMNGGMEEARAYDFDEEEEAMAAYG